MKYTVSKVKRFRLMKNNRGTTRDTGPFKSRVYRSDMR